MIFSEPLIWIIMVLLLASPLIYLAGRLGRYGLGDYGLQEVVKGPGFRPHLAFARGLAVLTLAGVWVPYALLVIQYYNQGPSLVFVRSIALRVDGISLLMAAVSLGLGFFVAIFSFRYMAGELGEEKYYAMLVAMIGVMVALGSAGDLFNLWVWFEAMAVSSYLLVVFYRQQPAALESGVKYVMQSAVGSVLVLMGIAVVLGQTGTLDLNRIQAAPHTSSVFLAAGALFITGFGVKAAIVPMHTWLPDAHTQAPSGISAMLSGVVIEAGLIAMLRTLAALTGVESGYVASARWGILFMSVAVVNMLLGNLMALRQTQVKRLLAYSSLSHMGYIVMGFGVALYGSQLAGAQGAFFHIINHALMKGLAFLAAGALLYAVSHLDSPQASSSDHGPLRLADLGGAARRYPWVALCFSLAVLGLGGLPPLAGFMSKWQIFVSGLMTQDPIIVSLMVFMALNSVLSLGYYAPLVHTLYRKQMAPAVEHAGNIPSLMVFPLILIAILVVMLGIYPVLAEWLTAPAASAFLTAFGK